METSYLQYSMSVIVARALPDVRDGLKPVHRRILYVMDKNNLSSGAKYTKSAQIVGEVMGKYHPHGDTAIYDAMVRLAQPFSTRYPLVDGQGNFGSMDGDPAAAYRYTEARMTKQSEAMLADIEKETVPFRDNFDGSQQEPEVLPARLPNLLLNGQIGIAVGMATNIPPHNLSELVDATVAMIDNPQATLDDLLTHIKGPDFPTGAVVYGKESIRTAFATGRGGVVVRGVAEIEEQKGGKHRIVITEIPYGVNKAGLVEKIADLVREKRLGGISDIRDESSRGGVRVVIDLKRDAYPKKLLNQLFKLTPLQTAFHYNMLALIDGIQPRVLGLADIISEHIKHRQIVIRRRTEFELRKAKERAHILEGLKTALDHIDEVIKTIRASQTTEEAEANLIKQFKLTVIQARAILAMQLRTLAGLERQKIEDELAQLIKIIAQLEGVLASEEKILKIIRDELLKLKEQFGDERKTKIVAAELGKLSDEDLVPDEQVVVTITAANYIKRTSIADYKRQGRGGKGRRGMTTRDEDVIEHVVNTSTHDFLLFFTNKGRVFRIKTYEVPAVNINAKGVALVNLLQLQPEEIVSSVINVIKQSAGGYLLMCTVRGVVKKTAFEQYQNVRSSGLIAINLDEGDELKWIRMTTGDNEVVISTSHGQAIRFHERDVRPMGRASRGVRGIRLRTGDQVIGMDIVEKDSSIFVISEFGYGKRTKIAQFTAHKRGGVGIRSAVVNKKTGALVGVKTLVGKDQEIIIISAQGQTIRLGLKNISSLGRATQGVRIMRLNSGDSVVSLALVEKVEEEDEETEPSEKLPKKAGKPKPKAKASVKPKPKK
ncbi:DNA gyrase subunit A [Candidatus Saccharibacteria bacterium RIFCSPLOWO2_01_FULL_48_13]|nr:MAG: DNA gyrase subunit A [Candidatus Saccharibacteria bacterium RIFCSPHIGHO2_01_FULL_48_12]OGL35409.1 MAG: DNA gyrase subunit A [Candidatus Saccharibacteria bacterium RIFCSPHIGHO2_12_FULL_48_21]OGL37139.1 MAG: DNA gyrase subunit A [Candidatus Saccharibacteria bacterium RIFCSPLOWO2_01_FULL_48_13]